LMAGVVAVMCIAIARQAKPLCGDDATPASSISSTSVQFLRRGIPQNCRSVLES